ncbi:MAG: sulfite exporter TauE/SafE family protein [Maricaulaceae bacterium]
MMRRSRPWRRLIKPPRKRSALAKARAPGLITAMQEFAQFWPLAAALAGAGVFAGLVAGLFGVGGGVVIVPALFYALNALGFTEAAMHVAVATSLATIIATSLRSAAAHHKRGAVDLAVLKAWSPWIVLGAVVGAALAGFAPGRALTGLFGVMAIAVAAQLAFGNPNWRIAAELPHGAARAGLGGMMGVLSALMGIGGGTFGVLLMTLCGRTIHQAVGTAAGFGVAIGAPAALGFVLTGLDAPGRPPGSLGYVSGPGFVLIASLTTVVAPWGARLAHALPQTALRRLFALGLTGAALSMIFSALQG